LLAAFRTVPSVPLLLAGVRAPLRFGFAALDLAVPFFDAAVLRLRADAADLDLVLVCPRDEREAAVERVPFPEALVERLLGWLREFALLAICPSRSGSPLPVVAIPGFLPGNPALAADLAITAH
jgi:hypothetical protein